MRRATPRSPRCPVPAPHPRPATPRTLPPRRAHPGRPERAADSTPRRRRPHGSRRETPRPRRHRRPVRPRPARRDSLPASARHRRPARPRAAARHRSSARRRRPAPSHCPAAFEQRYRQIHRHFGAATPPSCRRQPCDDTRLDSCRRRPAMRMPVAGSPQVTRDCAARAAPPTASTRRPPAPRAARPSAGCARSMARRLRSCHDAEQLVPRADVAPPLSTSPAIVRCSPDRSSCIAVLASICQCWSPGRRAIISRSHGSPSRVESSK